MVPECGHLGQLEQQQPMAESLLGPLREDAGLVAIPQGQSRACLTLVRALR